MGDVHRVIVSTNIMSEGTSGEKMRTLSFLLLTLALWTGTARADYPSSAAADCQVGDPAIQANRYLVTGGSISYQSTATGVITLYCPVKLGDIRFGDPNSFIVTYADTDGTGTNTNITAQLISLNVSNGALTTLTTPINSNAYATTSGGTMTQSLSGITWDFVNKYYYIRVDLNRTAATSYSTLYGIYVKNF